MYSKRKKFKTAIRNNTITVYALLFAIYARSDISHCFSFSEATQALVNPRIGKKSVET
jgi:hypothetical protein